MTKFRSLYILLPCHSMEDFPVHFTGDDAKGLLAAWTAMWHPSLISSSQSMVKWHRAEEIPEDLDHSLVMIPSVSESSIPDSIEQRCKETGSQLCRNLSDRKAILESVLTDLDPVSSDLAKDFLALGYGFLQVQLMTRQLRYSSNLDEEKFESLVVRAAKAAFESESDSRSQLQACFDLLLEEKSRYYPVEANLIDLTLLAGTTLGEPLVRQLARPIAQNLLMTGDLVDELKSSFPATLEAIRIGVNERNVHLVGGNQTELNDPLLSQDTIARGLESGNRAMHEVFGVAPEVYARRKTGLFPALPELLEKGGYRGVLHASLDEGRFPTVMSSQFRWEAPSGDSVAALSSIPLDASSEASFLDLGIRIGEAIDSEHYSAVVFAHWPERFSFAYEDLMRIHKYGPLLGNFVTFLDHFDSVYDPGFGETRTAPDYRNAYLKQSVQLKEKDPISRYVRYWNRIWAWRSLSGLVMMASVHRNAVDVSLDEQMASLAAKIDRSVASGSEESGSIDKMLDRLRTQVLDLFPTKQDTQSTLVNPLSFGRQVAAVTTESTRPSVDQGSIYLRDSDSDQSHWVVKASPFGHTLLRTDSPDKSPKFGPPVLDELSLKNEFFQLTIDESTGGIRSLNVYDRRTNLLTQRLSCRQSGTHPSLDQPTYAEMVARSVESKSFSRIAGEIRSSGVLRVGETVLAEFEQKVRVNRGSRLIDFEIQLSPTQEIAAKTGWDHYFCNRFAWGDEAAALRRGLHFNAYETNEQRLCAPEYIEIQDDDLKMTFVTGGLPYHQRSGARQLDSLLMTAGESNRCFRFAVAVNPRYSSQCVADWMCPPLLLENRRLNQASDGWLFHLGSRNMMATQVRILASEDGKPAGVAMRAHETEGRRGKMKIHCPRKPKRALVVDHYQNPIEELQIEGDCVLTDFLGSQMLDIEIYW